MLGEALRHLGFEVGRLKTGTPPRLDARTIDFTQFQEQPGDPVPTPFNFRTKSITQPQTICWITYTHAETHRTIRGECKIAANRHVTATGLVILKPPGLLSP